MPTSVTIMASATSILRVGTRSNSASNCLRILFKKSMENQLAGTTYPIGSFFLATEADENAARPDAFIVVLVIRERQDHSVVIDVTFERKIELVVLVIHDLVGELRFVGGPVVSRR